MGEAALVTAPGAVVRVDRLRKQYGRRVALDGVALQVRRNEIYGLIGPDGAGKSSLMKAVAGVLDFDEGEVEVFGVRLDSEAAAERVKDRIGFMPQGLGLNLYPELTVEENVDFFARLREVPAAALVERKRALLAMTRLEPFRGWPMKQLSGGMKQKLALVCTLIHEPELVILDEPTTGVDPVSRRDFWAILAHLLRRRGTTALVSTAYMDEAARFDRIALVFGGRVVAQGAPDAIRSSLPGRKARVRAEPQPEALRRIKAQFPQAEALGSWIQAFVPDVESREAMVRLREALSGLAVHELDISEPDLEDVFVSLLERERLIASPAAAAPSDPVTAAPVHDDVVIEARELCRDFGRFRAVDRVSFRVREGEIFGLLGSNGAGKTTVIRMLTGILPPSEGSGRVAGIDIHRAGREVKARIGYMSQMFSLYTDLTVSENIKLYAGIYGLSAAQARERAAWIVRMGDLEGHEADQAGSLPLGLRQRLALGCALVHRPRVLFLDEPTSGVDPAGRRRFWDMLFRLSREEGVTILVTTHYMVEAEYCDHLALMFAGRLVADAPPAVIKREAEAEAGTLLELSTDQPVLALEKLTELGYHDTALFARHVHLLSREPQLDRQRVPALLADAGVHVQALTPRPFTMEDVFAYRIGALERQARAGGSGT